MSINSALNRWKQGNGWHAESACEESFVSGYKAALEEFKDDPEADGTDFAHPAWWRGCDAASLMCMDHVNRILDGKETKDGSTCNEPWQSLRLRLFDIRTMLGLAERVISGMPFSRTSKFYLTILQWYKVRKDYDQRVQGKRAAEHYGEKMRERLVRENGR